MKNAPYLDTIPICSLSQSCRKRMILRRSLSRLCKTNDSTRSCPRKKIKLKMYPSDGKHKSLEMKQKTPHLDNSVSFRESPINLITSTPLQKSLPPHDNGRKNLRNSNLATTIKRKSSNRNILSSDLPSATPKSILGSGMRITRSMSLLSQNSNCRSTRSQPLSKLSVNNLPYSKSMIRPCAVFCKKISFNLDDSDINDTALNSRKLSLRSSSRKNPSLHLTSTPVPSASKRRGRSKKKADKDSNNNNITSLHSQKSSDSSLSNNMTLRSADSSKKRPGVASCVGQSGDNALQYLTPVAKKDQNTRSKRSKTRQTYSPSSVKRDERSVTFGGRIPMDDLCLTSKHNARRVQSDIVPVKKPCLTSKRNTQKAQSHIDIPVDSLCTTSRRSTRKVQSDSKYKRPGKYTLKRKRAVIDAIKKGDESYEDDIYEGKKFDHFKDLFTDSPDESEVSFSIPTPKFGFSASPVVRQKTPKIGDCFSPRTFALSRKMAEEYIYRRNKMRKAASVPAVTPSNSRQKRMSFQQVMSNVAKVQDAIERLRNDESDGDDDSNLSF